MTRSSVCPEYADAIDLDLIAQRVLKLAEIAVLEHLDAVDRSQAVGLAALWTTAQEDPDGAERRP